VYQTFARMVEERFLVAVTAEDFVSAADRDLMQEQLELAKLGSIPTAKEQAIIKSKITEARKAEEFTPTIPGMVFTATLTFSRKENLMMKLKEIYSSVRKAKKQHSIWMKRAILGWISGNLSRKCSITLDYFVLIITECDGLCVELAESGSSAGYSGCHKSD
jgi:hypothetical protein